MNPLLLHLLAVAIGAVLGVATSIPIILLLDYVRKHDRYPWQKTISVENHEAQELLEIMATLDPDAGPEMTVGIDLGSRSAAYSAFQPMITAWASQVKYVSGQSIGPPQAKVSVDPNLVEQWMSKIADLDLTTACLQLVSQKTSRAMARIATWSEIVASMSSKYLEEQNQKIIRNREMLKALSKTPPPAPLLRKIRETLISALPIRITVLYCSPDTQTDLIREFNARNMPFTIDFEDDFTHGDIQVDGATISVLPGTPDGEFIFFPG